MQIAKGSLYVVYYTDRSSARCHEQTVEDIASYFVLNSSQNTLPMADQSFVIRKSVALQAKIAFAVTVLISGFLVFQLFRMLQGVYLTRELWALGFLVLMAIGFTWHFYHVMNPHRVAQSV
jgi:hypothetical protein